MTEAIKGLIEGLKIARSEAIKGLIEGLIEVAISTGMNHEDEEAFASGLERVEQEMAVLEWASEK